MSSVIDFLERMGRDSDLRHAPASALARALTDHSISDFARKVLLGGDQRRLEFLVEAPAIVCCAVTPPIPSGDSKTKTEPGSAEVGQPVVGPSSQQRAVVGY